MDAGKARAHSVVMDTSKLDNWAKDAASDQSSLVKEANLGQTPTVLDANSNMIDTPNLAKDDHVFVSGPWPSTPDTIGDRRHIAASTPLSLTKPVAHDVRKRSADATYDDICTPKGSVFDPLIADRHPKQGGQEDTPSSAVRSLNFDNAAADQMVVEETVVSESEEETLFQTIYGAIIEEIIVMQAKGVTDSVGFGSPTSVPKLSGIAETCPPAPLKQPNRSKFRNIDRSLCRKLEF
ncbi:OLC1v1022152C1 [Oldenlandia corymbosa var. corymbosa]|uniref:OLC1v1022152C1 n=1 Tax=Oldenlandia corymbosa var. corymbosa TaxID=529605 RepID=A0AAV1BZH3_OLDCO|nr:OLC1v1022152C1 [Oldenlandia corymbosa var. corymbosa]